MTDIITAVINYIEKNKKCILCNVDLTDITDYVFDCILYSKIMNLLKSNYKFTEY